MASKLQQERRAEFKRYKEDVAKEGKPFFPYAILHDTIMSLVVVAVIIGARRDLEVHDPTTATSASLGPLYDRQGRPGHDELRAAPRLVLLLPLLPAAHLQVARDGRARHGRRADAPARAPDRAAVLRPPARARDSAPPGRVRRRDPRHPLDGRAHLEGRDREGVARLRERRARAGVGRASRASPTTRSPSRARRSSPSRAA